MWNINRNRARLLRRSIIVQTMKFNSYWKSKKHRAKRPWIAHLNGDHAPDKWPSIMAWRNYKKRWIAYRSAAYKFVDNPKAFPMKCDAVDYGGPNEIPIGARTGQLERIECLDGKTLQWYWGKAK